MEHAIPGFASSRLASVPKFLASVDVERVIDSCTGYVFALRDRAVLLLLARLALRASEVAQLKFTDIDWRNGVIRVCGKGRRQESLPLAQEVDNAILLYGNVNRSETFATWRASQLPPGLDRAGLSIQDSDSIAFRVAHPEEHVDSKGVIGCLFPQLELVLHWRISDVMRVRLFLASWFCGRMCRYGM
jgi:integrase